MSRISVCCHCPASTQLLKSIHTQQYQRWYKQKLLTRHTCSMQLRADYNPPYKTEYLSASTPYYVIIMTVTCRKCEAQASIKSVLYLQQLSMLALLLHVCFYVPMTLAPLIGTFEIKYETDTNYLEASPVYFLYCYCRDTFNIRHYRRHLKA